MMRHLLILSVVAAVACVGASPDTKLTPANFAQEVFQPGTCGGVRAGRRRSHHERQGCRTL